MLSQTLKTILLFCSLFLCQAYKTIGDVLDENPKLYYYGDNCSPESFEIYKRTYNKQYNMSEELNKYAAYCENLD